MDAPTLPPIEEFDAPQPRRFRWLIRLSIVYALALVLAVAGWFAWNAAANRMVAAEIARIRALGEPILADDFNAFEPLPAERNALTYLARAWKLNLNKQQDDVLNEFSESINLTDKELATIRALPADVAENLKQLRAARPFNAQRTTPVKTPLINVLLPHLNSERELANVVRMAMYARHLEGNDAEVVELLRDLLHGAKTLDQRTCTLVEHLVAIGINAMATDMVAKYGQKLAVEKSASTTQPSTPATRAQIKALIAELLDESSLTAGQIAAMQGERAMELDTAVALASNPGVFRAIGMGGPAGATPVSIVIGPSFKISGVRCSQSTSNLVERAKAAAMPVYTGGRPKLMRVEMPMTGITRMTRRIESILTPSLTKALEVHFRLVLERRVAATHLAIRLYQLDHAGQFPEKLDELVPTYLAAIPADPFATDGHPIRYLRHGDNEGTPSPLLYGVSFNHTDEHASTKPTSLFPRSRSDPWNQEDAVYPLIPLPPKEREREPDYSMLQEVPAEPSPEPTTMPATAPAE